MAGEQIDRIRRPIEHRPSEMQARVEIIVAHTERRHLDLRVALPSGAPCTLRGGGLYVVGDFAYHVKQAKNAFLGKELVPFLLNHYPRVEAKAIVPAGLTARAAAAQNAVQGGTVEPAVARMVVTQKDFYRFLCCDIQNAKSRLVIYSAFLSRSRLGELQTALRSAVDRGIKVYVVTKALNDRQKTEIATYRMLEKALAGWNIRVVHKSRMHEKLVFVDETIVWTGSLNPLRRRPEITYRTGIDL